MSLIEIAIEIDDERRPRLVRELIAAGALGVEDRGAQLVVYATSESELHAFLAVLDDFQADGAQKEGGQPEPNAIIRYLELDYDRAWLDALEPVELADRFVLRPTTKRPARPGEKTIWYEPDVSFGSGEHETTQLACRKLVELTKSLPQGQRRLFDVGTGTGVLSLIAAKCGLDSALAVDIDERSTRAAQKNLALNGLESRVSVRLGSADCTDESFPLVCANIISKVLLQIGTELAERVAPGGRLLLSGLLATEREELGSFFEAQGLRLVESETLGDWGLLLLERPVSAPRGHRERLRS